MTLTGKGNVWTDHVKAFATKNNISYMCAMSNPECSATYKGVKGAKPVKAKKAKKPTKKEEKENITMSMEDKPAPARKERLEDIFESTTPVEGFSSPAVRAVLKNKGSLNKALEKKKADQEGMMAEDINRIVPDTKGKKAKAGRPAKYATQEEARKAKIANTIRRAKERVGEKKDARLEARIEKAKGLYKNLLSNLKSWYGNGEDTSKPDWYKGRAISLDTYNEFVDKILKKFKGVKKEDFTGGSFNVEMTKTGGMLGWVKSIIGRHPNLTPEQIRDAERFANEQMADPTGVSFEGAMVIPVELRKELAEEAHNRKMMGREDKDATGDASDVFADEISKQLKKQKLGKGTCTSKVNPPTYANTPIERKGTQYFKRVYGKKKAQVLPDYAVVPVPPVVAPKKGRGKTAGGATALQKGLSAELRSYTKQPLQQELNQIIHSNDAPSSRYGQIPNAYRNYANQYDAKAQKQIDRAIAVLVKKGVIHPSSVPTGSGPPVFTGDYRGPEVQAERRRLTREYYDNQKQGGAVASIDVLKNYSKIIDHLVSHITDPSEPVDPRDYHHTIRLINGIRELKGGRIRTANDFFRHIADPRRTGMGNSDVRSPTSTRTEVRSPTKTSTEAYTRGNVTITGSAGDGPMSVYIAGQPRKGGADQPPAPPNTPAEPEADDGMGGIDWFAIGQALLQDEPREDVYDPDGPNAPQP